MANTRGLSLPLTLSYFFTPEREGHRTVDDAGIDCKAVYHTL